MDKTKGLLEYAIQANINVVAIITRRAASLDDALEQSKDLRVIDFIEFNDKNGFIDGEIKITGMFEV